MPLQDVLAHSLAGETATRPKVIIFDVNETLLDLNSMQAAFNEAFDHPFAFKQWFSLLLQYSLVDTVTGHYHDFGTIGKATLKMAAQLLDKQISDEKQTQLLGMIRQRPPHPDVKEGLTQLQRAGYRLATLTNSAGQVAKDQLAYAGLTSFFEASFTVDDFKVYKPHPDTYLKTADRLKVKPAEAMLIAAHGWDVTGAAHAGMQTGFIARPGQVTYPLAPAPGLTGKTLTDLAGQLTKS